MFVADQVDAGDLDAHAVGGVDLGRLPIEILRRCDESGREHAVTHAVLVTVGVVEERLERAHALTPASTRDHSSKSMTRGTASRGNGRSSPAKSNVTPCARYELASDSVRPRSSSCVARLRERLIELSIRCPGRSRLARTHGMLEHLVERGNARHRLAQRQRGAVAVEQIAHAVSLVAGVFPECVGMPRHREFTPDAHPAALGSARGHRCTHRTGGAGSPRRRRGGDAQAASASSRHSPSRHRRAPSPRSEAP